MTKMVVLLAMVAIGLVVFLAVFQSAAQPPAAPRPLSDAEAYALRTDADTRARVSLTLADGAYIGLTLVGLGVGVGVALTGLALVLRQVLPRLQPTQLYFLERGKLIGTAQLLTSGKKGDELVFRKEPQPTKVEVVNRIP